MWEQIREEDNQTMGVSGSPVHIIIIIDLHKVTNWLIKVITIPLNMIEGKLWNYVGTTNNFVENLWYQINDHVRTN